MKQEVMMMMMQGQEWYDDEYLSQNLYSTAIHQNTCSCIARQRFSSRQQSPLFI